MSGIKLLLVDDEEEFVRAMAARLALRQVPSRVALSGEAALQAVAADAPHVMVLDLRMPGIDGMEVLERVKREHPYVQVIVLTGRGSASEREDALRLGAFRCLDKPADPGQLLGVIREAWRRALALLKQSGEGLSRYAAAAAMAEEGGRELALEQLLRPVEKPEQAAGATDTAGKVPEAARAGLEVLFVDDEEDFVRTLAERMEMRSLGGTVALSGREALAVLEQNAPDVMVLDLRMPGLDGLEVLRRVKEAHPRVEVIILTGHGSAQDEEEARRLGAFAYLHKPVDLEQLIVAVRQAQHAARSGGPAGEVAVPAPGSGPASP